MLPFLGSLISAGTSLLGGIMGRDAQADANAANLAFAYEQMEEQRKYAQNSIRWRVRDATRAGVHPLYALGAPTMGYSTVAGNQVAEIGLAEGIARSGQDIGRAIAAGTTGTQRDLEFTRAIQNLQLTRAGLENELLASQIGRLKSAQLNPPLPAGPFPVPEGTKIDPNAPMMINGNRWMGSGSTSPMRTFEDQYGDDGPASWFFQALKMGADMENNFGNIKTWPRQMVNAGVAALWRDLQAEWSNARRYFGYR